MGWVWITNTWQDVTEHANLLRKRKEWLEDNQFEDLTLELTAVDLSMMDSDYDAFECGDRIQCRAKPYGMNRVFPVMEMQIPLQKPDGATLTLGENRKLTYTEQQSRTIPESQQQPRNAGKSRIRKSGRPLIT